MGRLYRLILWSLVASGLAGCAIRRETEPKPTPEARLARGLAALRVGNYRMASSELDLLAALYPASRAADQARVVLAGIELDPRNTDRRPAVGVDLIAKYLTTGGSTPENRPLAELLYLLALEVGAEEPAAAGPLPRLPGESMAARLASVTEQRDRLRRELARATSEIKGRDEQLQKLRQELERIRKTLRP